MRKAKTLLIAAALVSAAAVTASAADDNARKDYMLWMKDELPECPEFDAWQDSTGILPPDFDALASRNILPDPFTFADGRKVGPSVSDWEVRRQEILDLFIKYEFGTLPPKPKITSVDILEETKGEGYVSRTVKINFGPDGKGSVRASLTIPQTPKGGKLPVLISTSLSGMGNTLVRRGYISAGFAGSDFMDDGEGLKEVYPEYTFAALPRRAWILQMVLDYFETVPEVDMDRIAIYGYSRDGKMAAIAAALDKRISALIAGSTGVGGFVPWRYAGERGGGESIESTTRMFPTWFIPELRFFSGREDKLPVDANLLLALIAPRAVLMEWGFNDEVANGWAQERVYESALPVFQRYGAADKVSLLHVPGFHGSNDMQACIDFLDIQFGRSSRKWNYDFTFPWDRERWISESGVSINPKSYPVVDTSKPIAKKLKDWENAKARIIAAVNSILGQKPVTIETKGGRGGFFFGGAQKGPIEALEGSFNPGQLKPDVHSWVIRRYSAEFGWLKDDAAGVASKRVTFGPDSVTGDLYYPEGTAEGTKLPVVIWMHGYHFPLGYMWVYRRDVHPILALVKEGFAVLAYDQTGYGERYNEYANFYDRYPQWSRLGRMVEDVSSAVTALEKEDLVDASNITLYGFTLGASASLYAAALDQRIRNVVSVCGFTPMRTDLESRGLTGLARYDDLYATAPRLGFFKGSEDRIPYDYDDLIALTAPRGVLIVQPSMDRDADIEGVKAAVSRASAIYKLEDAESQLSLLEPEDYGRLTNKTQILIIDWIKKHTK